MRYFLAIVWLLGAATAATAEARLDKLEVQREGRQVLVSIELADAFDEELKAQIESGLATGIEYELQLAKDRKRWWDRPLRTAKLQLVAMYNAVTRDYLVNVKLDDKLIEKSVTGKAAALRYEGGGRIEMTLRADHQVSLKFTDVPAAAKSHSSTGAPPAGVIISRSNDSGLTTGSNERSQIPIKMPVADVDHGSESGGRIGRVLPCVEASEVPGPNDGHRNRLCHLHRDSVRGRSDASSTSAGRNGNRAIPVTKDAVVHYYCW